MSEDIVERKPDDYVDIPALQAALRRTFDCFADTTILEAINALGMLEQKLIDSVPKSEAWDAISKKNAELTRLREENERLKGANRAFAEQVTNDYKEIKRLRAALQFYADKKHKADDGRCIESGQIARSALQQKDSE